MFLVESLLSEKQIK